MHIINSNVFSARISILNSYCYGDQVTSLKLSSLGQAARAAVRGTMTSVSTRKLSRTNEMNDICRDNSSKLRRSMKKQPRSNSY